MSTRSVRMFEVGDICVHKGYICRVDAVKRQITGDTTPSLSYMNVKDGTEFNPTLVMTPLFGPNGDPVKKAKPMTAPSGAARRASEAIAELESQAEVIQKRLARLR